MYEQFSAHTLPNRLDSFETYLANKGNKKFFVGKRLSLVDFILYELLWQMTLMVPNSISESSHATLFTYINAFEAIPEIAAYLKSEFYIERPINSPWASFA